jgi:hypothetical protein
MNEKEDWMIENTFYEKCQLESFLIIPTLNFSEKTAVLLLKLDWKHHRLEYK